MDAIVVDQFYERLFVRAATIDEILSDDFETIVDPDGSSGVAQKRMAAWCRASSDGDWSHFAERLGRDGWSIESVLARFAGCRRKPGVPPPRWHEDAKWIVLSLGAFEAEITEPNASSPETGDIPFGDLFGPLVREAEERAVGPERAVLTILAPSAMRDLRISLFRKLSDLMAPALYEVFDAARNGFPIGENLHPNPCYREFARRMRSVGYHELFCQKPVLLRLVAVGTAEWISTTREFLSRLLADATTIREFVGAAVDAKVIHLECAMSDPHNGGRCVLVAEFEDACPLVYKPKDLRLDSEWQKFIARLNQIGAPIDLRVPSVLVRHGYGWAEYVEHAPCGGADGPGLFFRRAGAWLALFHFAAGTDLHNENLVACGDHPVPVDVEMLFQAPASERKMKSPAADAQEAAAERISNSVLSTGLLPAFVKTPQYRGVPIGGLVADTAVRRTIKWMNTNSDRMHPQEVSEGIVAHPHLPQYAGAYADVGSYGEEVVEGFSAYASFLEKQRDGGDTSLFDQFRGLPTRKVVRATRFYFMLMQRLRDHRTMHDGVEWSAQADFVARLSDWSRIFWPIVGSERRTLLDLNVPFFRAYTDVCAIEDSSGLAIETETSGFERANERLRANNSAYADGQIDLIRISVSRTRPIVRRPQIPQVSLVSDGHFKDFLLQEANAVALHLERACIRGSDCAAWIGAESLGESDRWQAAPMAADLYSGLSGIALFFAAHALVTGSEASRKIALDSLAFPRLILTGRNAQRTARNIGIGGATGICSIIYAFSTISKLLQEEALLDDARRMTTFLTSDLIEADRQLDVLGGSAGAILSLLRLQRDSPGDEVLQAAIGCADHLMALPRYQNGLGGRSWIGQAPGGLALAGMSHGASGFAYALGCLAAKTNRSDLRVAAVECIEYENSNFDAALCNWPNLHRKGVVSFTSQWCHGAAGIGLARVGLRKCGILSENAIDRDIQRAADGVMKDGLSRPLDTLCCGTLGNIEFLLIAAVELMQGELMRAGKVHLMHVVGQARATGDYRWSNSDKRFNLGLFRGLAGVGYTILRRLDPRIPNVLLWE
ncbi:MAG: type 2 lantipeptide synthetase LanM [Mesorhizobium sp.]|nr:MAG: type 2 lantipeptide synthetase LanM [Mesorhizobium sp.]